MKILINFLAALSLQAAKQSSSLAHFGTGLAVPNLKVVSSKELRLVWVSRSKWPSAWIKPTLKTTESDFSWTTVFSHRRQGVFKL